MNNLKGHIHRLLCTCWYCLMLTLLFFKTEIKTNLTAEPKLQFEMKILNKDMILECHRLSKHKYMTRFYGNYTCTYVKK